LSTINCYKGEGIPSLEAKMTLECYKRGELEIK
jgi:hypothetical protein